MSLTKLMFNPWVEQRTRGKIKGGVGGDELAGLQAFKLCLSHAAWGLPHQRWWSLLCRYCEKCDLVPLHILLKIAPWSRVCLESTQQVHSKHIYLRLAPCMLLFHTTASIACLLTKNSHSLWLCYYLQAHAILACQSPES